MINFSLDLPPTKKKTRDQKAMEWMIQNARGPSSKGYYEKFKKRILEARKKDDAINKANKRVSALEWIDANIGMYEKDATPKQKEVLKKMQKRLATKPTEENLYNTYLNLIQSGDLLPNTSFKDFEKNFSGYDVQVKKPKNVRDPSFKKKPTSPVEIDWDLPATHEAKLWPKIKGSSLMKLIEHPYPAGTDLSYEALRSIIDLLQSSGFLKDGGRVK